MFTGDEDMQATALWKKGWTISAIARHLERDRKTIRAHLGGEREAGVRKRSEPDLFGPFVGYVTARLKEDPHLWASALFDELRGLGYDQSYQSLTRKLRERGLRPHCEACHGVKGRVTIEIEHPPGEEIQWDWNELPDAPWGGDAHLLVGSLPCSGRFRGVFSEAEDQAHLAEAIDGVLRRLGGTAANWRFDRMARVVDPSTGIVQASFVPIAKHYAVRVVACPPRRGNRKGSVEKSIHYATGRFWRTMTARTPAEAQQSFDRFSERIGDRRPRPLHRFEEIAGAEVATRILAERGRRRPTVADLAELEVLRSLPAVPYPATKESPSAVGPSGLAAFEGNAYSVPHGLSGTEVLVRHRIGSELVEVVSPAGLVVASHHRVAPGRGQVVRNEAHRVALEHDILAVFTTTAPCRKKANRPPGEAARAEARELLSSYEDREVVVSLTDYQAIVDEMTAWEAGK